MDVRYIVEGAKIRCSKGEKATRLKLPDDHGYYFLKKPVLNDLDCIAGVNVMPFGNCSIKRKCQPPALFSRWEETQKDKLIEGRPALLKSSFLGCAAGGCITIETDGQEISDLIANQKIEWNALAVACNGANPVVDSLLLDPNNNSLSAQLYRTYCISTSGDIQITNSIPGAMGVIGAVGDTKLVYAKQDIAKIKVKGAGANAGKRFKAESLDKLGPFRGAAKIGQRVNLAACLITIGMDVSNNIKDLASTKFASELGADLAILGVMIKLTTAAGTIVDKKWGTVDSIIAMLIVGGGLNMIADGLTFGGNPTRTWIQGWAKNGFENMKKEWTKPTVDQNEIKTIRSFR